MSGLMEGKWNMQILHQFLAVSHESSNRAATNNASSPPHKKPHSLLVGLGTITKTMIWWSLLCSIFITDIGLYCLLCFWYQHNTGILKTFWKY
jgi:hypothetical protein